MRIFDYVTETAKPGNTVAFIDAGEYSLPRVTQPSIFIANGEPLAPCASLDAAINIARNNPVSIVLLFPDNDGSIHIVNFNVAD